MSDDVMKQIDLLEEMLTCYPPCDTHTACKETRHLTRIAREQYETRERFGREIEKAQEAMMAFGLREHKFTVAGAIKALGERAEKAEDQRLAIDLINGALNTENARLREALTWIACPSGTRDRETILEMAIQKARAALR